MSLPAVRGEYISSEVGLSFPIALVEGPFKPTSVTNMDVQITSLNFNVDLRVLSKMSATTRRLWSAATTPCAAMTMMETAGSFLSIQRPLNFKNDDLDI